MKGKERPHLCTHTQTRRIELNVGAFVRRCHTIAKLPIHRHPNARVTYVRRLLFIRLSNDEWITIFQTNQTEQKRNRLFEWNELNETFTTTHRSQSAAFEAAE